MPHHCQRAFVAFGTNLGDAARAHADAIAALTALPDTQLRRCSALYRSAPLGVEGHPDYTNGVFELDTALAPLELLDALLDIERRHGRIRGIGIAPRTLDLDLLLYGNQRIDSARLTLPHPRMHLRAFVIVPLAEIAPGIELPDHGPLPPLLHQLRNQRIEKIHSAAASPAVDTAPA